MSYGFLDQDGLVVGDGYSSKRHNARISVNTEVYDRLKLTGQMSYVDFYKKDLGYSGTSGVFRLSQRMSPLLPVMWQIPDENGRMVDSENWSYGSVRNPLQVAYESGMEEQENTCAQWYFQCRSQNYRRTERRYAVLCKYIYPPGG